MYFIKPSESIVLHTCKFVLLAFFTLGTVQIVSGQYAIVQKNATPTILLASLSEGMKQSLEEKWDSSWITRDWIKASNGKWNVVVMASHVLKPSWCNLCLPVYHTVKKGETLGYVSQHYAAPVSVAQLKRINKLKSEYLVAGRKLIVGYIEMQPLGTPGPASEFTDAIWPREKQEVTKPATQLYMGSGYFEKEWQPLVNETATQAMIGCFKAETGWEDGKFYMLHNHIPPGKIVKIINPSNGTTIYAKVAATLPKLKMNDGLQARVCTAAGAMLGIGENQVEELVLSY